MTCAHAGPALRRPAFEVADVFRAHGEAYRRAHAPSGVQQKAMRDIEACRTQALGGHLDACPDPACGFERPAYNSCRNRHCPKCQSLTQARWIERRCERLLPTHSFHVVFTLPAELRTLVRRNRRRLFDLLFEAGSQSLLDLAADPERLGGTPGFTCVLHTWTRKLEFHPHLHCIVTGGGLSPAGDRWIPLGEGYLFPVEVLRALFRGKVLAGLRRLHARDKLHLPAPISEPAAFAALLDRLYRTPWHVYVKRPFAGPEQVFRYLGRYTHKVGISNQRIQLIDQDGIRFATKDGDAVTLPHETFIRRFLDHVLPKGFTKIRHYGLYAGANVHHRLETARALLSGKPLPDPNRADLPTKEPLPWNELLKQLTGRDPTRCPRCGLTLHRRPLPFIAPGCRLISEPEFTDTS